MVINDEGIIIGQKKFGERGIILTVFSMDNGLVRGLNRISKNKNKPLLFDLISFSWKSRISNGLGYINFEVLKTFFSSKEKYIFTLLKASASEICLKLLPQKEANKKIYIDLTKLVQLELVINRNDFFKLFKLYILWEISLLNNIGYGFDFTKCAVSGTNENLAYISPKTGQVVSEKVGKPWDKKLLKLPNFLIKDDEEITKEELKKGFILNEFFFNKILVNLSNQKTKKFIYRKELFNYFLNYY
jgi:DNA repair protein RecO (recombination protein O)